MRGNKGSGVIEAHQKAFPPNTYTHTPLCTHHCTATQQHTYKGDPVGSEAAPRRGPCPGIGGEGGCVGGVLEVEGVAVEGGFVLGHARGRAVPGGGPGGLFLGDKAGSGGGLESLCGRGVSGEWVVRGKASEEKAMACVRVRRDKKGGEAACQDEERSIGPKRKIKHVTIYVTEAVPGS